MEVIISTRPIFRRLRAYAFDPSLSLQIDTAKINKITHPVKWEDLHPGPIGEYLEVIDYDPTIGLFYKPIDLNQGSILADNGLSPSVSNPQFHQQMVYAVAMITIQNFELALGRKIIWSPKRTEGAPYEEYVQRLRIYPHALRDANAFYSPTKKALLFGYFNSTPADKVIHMPNALVFTCLSHDIIAHEVTHAILDGIHQSYNNPTNPDMLAFHEAFADIVALFQHFTYPEVLRHEIAKTKGQLSNQNMLGKLAYELGAAIGGYSSLRDAIGSIDPKTKEWIPHEANPAEYETIDDPHGRGSILVAAIFEAFLTIYESRIADLIRISTNGSGILDEGALHPDLVNRLVKEAGKSAQHVLNMCIRALDYCPPVDLTFGDYLRAILTADFDLVAYDDKDYRLAFVDAFRKRGIYPNNIKTLSLDSLIYPRLNIKYDEDAQVKIKSNVKLKFDKNGHDGSPGNLVFKHIQNKLKDYAHEIQYITDRREIYNITKDYIAGNFDDSNEKGLHASIANKFSSSLAFSQLTGLVFLENFRDLGIKASRGIPSFYIDNLRAVSRVGPDGNQLNQVVFSIMQRCYCRREKGKIVPIVNTKNVKSEQDVIIFYGGATMIFDLDKDELKYVMSKPILNTEDMDRKKIEIDATRALAQYRYQNHDLAVTMGEARRYFGTTADDFIHVEPFAILHEH